MYTVRYIKYTCTYLYICVYLHKRQDVRETYLALLSHHGDDIALGALNLGSQVAVLDVRHPAVLLAIVGRRLLQDLLLVDAQVEEVRIIDRNTRHRASAVTSQTRWK